MYLERGQSQILFGHYLYYRDLAVALWLLSLTLYPNPPTSSKGLKLPCVKVNRNAVTLSLVVMVPGYDFTK